MTKDNKKIFLHFVTRTGMYINPMDDKNAVSFIHGYEIGTKHRCDFTQLISKYIADKYKITQSNDGWSEQIERLAQKLSLSWMRTFKKITLEIIATEDMGLDEEMRKILKTRITSLIDRINELGDPWFNENWVQEWLSLCPIKSKWFKPLWIGKEWPIIKAIDKEVQLNNIFSKKGNYIPTEQLLKLKDKYDKSTKK
jgi:hypothetical protein